MYFSLYLLFLVFSEFLRYLGLYFSTIISSNVFFFPASVSTLSAFHTPFAWLLRHLMLSYRLLDYCSLLSHITRCELRPEWFIWPYSWVHYYFLLSLMVLVVKSLPVQGHKRGGLDPRVGKIPWRRKWQPTPVFLPGEPHGDRSLVVYSLWRCKESDRTEGS